MSGLVNQIRQKASEALNSTIELASDFSTAVKRVGQAQLSQAELANAQNKLRTAQILEEAAQDLCECGAAEDQSEQLRAKAQILRSQVAGRFWQKQATSPQIVKPTIPALEAAPPAEPGSSFPNKVLIGVGAVALGVFAAKSAALRYAITRIAPTILGGTGTTLVRWGGGTAATTGGGLAVAEGTAALMTLSSQKALMLASAAGGLGLGALVLASASGANLPALPIDNQPETPDNPDPKEPDEKDEDCIPVVKELFHYDFSLPAVLAKRFAEELCKDSNLSSIQKRLEVPKLDFAFVIRSMQRFLWPELSEERIRDEFTTSLSEEYSNEDSVEYFLTNIQNNARDWRDVEKNFKIAAASAAVHLGLLPEAFVAYLLHWKEKLNPGNKDLSLLYLGRYRLDRQAAKAF